MFLNKVTKYLKNPRLIIIYFAKSGMLNFLPDEIYLKIMYRCRFQDKLNLNNPKTYNQKLQYLKLHDRNPEYCENVDKYRVREKIRSLIGDEYLVPCLGAYDKTEQIPWNDLPNKFVLKCTHGTHCSIVCRDKTKFDINNAVKNLNKWLNHNYYYDAREWPYKSISPMIMIEEYIDLSGEMMDIKFMCFSGKVKMILVHRNIVTDVDHTLNIFDQNWNKIESTWGVPRYNGNIDKPKDLDRIIEIANILSTGCPHVRVDFMLVDGRWYFGELTYYTAAGFKPFEDFKLDDQLGAWIDLRGIYEISNR